MASRDEDRPLLASSPEPSEDNPLEAFVTRVKRSTLTERVLGGSSLLFFILFLTFAILYGSTSAPAPPVPVEPPPPKSEVCLTSECVVGAARVLGNLDTSVRPCDDFYQFACGGWVKANPIPDAKSRISSFDTLNDANNRILRELLEGPYSLAPSVPKGQEDQDRANFDMVKALYNTCVNETAIEAAGADPLVKLVGKLDKKFADGLTSAIAFVHELGIGALLAIGAGQDLIDTDTNVLYVSQGSLSLPSPEYYTDAETVAVLHSVVAELMERVLGPTGPAKANYTQVADTVVALEKKLAAITIPAEDLQDPNATYNPTKLFDLRPRDGPSFSWLDYLALRFPEGDFPGLITPATVFIVETPKYLADLEAVLNETPLNDWAVLFRWRIVKAYAGTLGEYYREPGKKLREKLTGVKTDLPRWETCLRVVDTYLGFMEGKLFVDAAFSGDSRDAASKTIDGIKQMMIRRIPQLSWIDKATQTEAISKVKALKRKIGYPDITLDPKKLADKYKGLEIDGSSYFKNVLAADRWYESDNLKQILKPVDRTEWGMTPQTVNAYYNPPMNEIVFPAGILQPPFFTAGLPAYLNYGGIGSVVGHELTHAFDNNGRQFDKEGKLRDWWGPETSKNFDLKSQCFVNQYGNFTVKGPDGKEVNVNGKLTLGENLADVGGISRAFEAWKADAASPDGDTRNYRLPGLQSFTKEQLFFVSFAQVWCSAVRPETAVQRIRTDPHSPPVYRVLGAIKDTPQFKLAFGCEGPSPACQLW